MDSTDALNRSRCWDRRLNNVFFFRSHAQVEPSHWFLRWMAQTTCFRPRTVLLGDLDDEWRHNGKNMPQTFFKKGAWIGSFKPKRQNLYIAISPELLIRRTSDCSDHKRHFVGGLPLPQSKYMTDSAILKIDDVIILQCVVRFGQNSAPSCRITRQLRRNGRDQNW